MADLTIKKPLREKRADLLNYIRSNHKFLENNKQLFEIFEGDLLNKVKAILRKTLSPSYYSKIEERLIPINILRRVIDKLSKVYAKAPKRTVLVGKETDQQLLDYYVSLFDFDKRMNEADEYSNMLKGYALEPFMHTKGPRLRTLPFERFLPYSDDPIDPTEMTVFIKFMGKMPVIKKIRGRDKEVMKDIFFTYDDEEFDAFDEDLETYEPALVNNEGINPYQTIPFLYDGRSRTTVLPTMDTDTLQMSLVVPTLFSDASGVVMFQCFSIFYGIDIDLDNVTYSPNALWSLKSDARSEKQPQLNVLKPEADIDKILQFISSTFISWLETRGVRTSGIGQADVSTLSGISKIIDEMDTFEIRKANIERFRVAEKIFWEDKMPKIHNYWLSAGLAKGPAFSEEFEISIEFEEPKPMIAKKDIIAEKAMEVNSGFKSHETAIRELNPEWNDERVQEELNKISEIVITRNDGGQ